MAKTLYLDYAAATPTDDRVLAAMTPYFSEKFYNPSSPYLPAIEVKHDYEDAKSRLAKCIGVKSDEIVITAGATESINLAIASSSGHIVSSQIEHAAVLESVKKHDHTLVSPNQHGTVMIENIAKAIRPDTTLLSIALANNELGTVQPLRDIAELVKSVREKRLANGDKTPIYLHTDASQGVGQIDVSVSRLGVDMMTINAAKIYGPKQVALLWTDRSIKLNPTIVGGGQERGLRSGTENVAGTIGFAMALEIASSKRKAESDRLRSLRDMLQTMLLGEFDNAIVSGHPKRRLPGHLHISFPHIDGERILFRLETRGVLVATGSACAANKGTRSHVLTAIGLAPEAADGSLRITLGRQTTEADIRDAAKIIIEEINAEMVRIKI